jgi:hypothetical protein
MDTTGLAFNKTVRRRRAAAASARRVIPSDEEARALLHAIGPLTHLTDEVRIEVIVEIAAETGRLERFLQIAAARDM